MHMAMGHRHSKVQDLPREPIRLQCSMVITMQIPVIAVLIDMMVIVSSNSVRVS
jgi:hypothetical protein